MNLKFVQDIIHAQIKGYHQDEEQGLIDGDEMYISIQALNKLEVALKEFIKEANKIGKKQ